MYTVTNLEKEITERFGWRIVSPPKGAAADKGLYYLTHPLLHGEASMAIPVDLNVGTLTQAVASAARTFNKYDWIRHADLSKYSSDPYISVETQVVNDADYATQQLGTLCSALGLR